MTEHARDQEGNKTEIIWRFPMDIWMDWTSSPCAGMWSLQQDGQGFFYGNSGLKEM